MNPEEFERVRGMSKDERVKYAIERYLWIYRKGEDMEDAADYFCDLFHLVKEVL